MLYAILGLICGATLGYFTQFGIKIDNQYSIYFLLIILAMINSVFTILTKKNIDEFKIKYCFIYVFIDIILSIAIGFVSEKIGLPLYLALIFAFGNNIYKNLSIIINSLIKKKVV